MAKPFKSLAAITLTVVRIAVSWFLSGVEFACAMLYSTPAYAAVVAGFGLMVVNSLVKAITGPKRELAKVGATVTTPAPERVAPVQTTAAGVVKAEPKKEEPVAEEKKVVEEKKVAEPIVAAPAPEAPKAEALDAVDDKEFKFVATLWALNACIVAYKLLISPA